MKTEVINMINKMNKIENEFEQLRFEADENFRELPKIKIGRQMFYRDEIKGEYRHVNNPDIKISFQEYGIVRLAQQIINRTIYGS
jgi:hypothetical protein